MNNKRRYFQWIAGEMKGEVALLEDIEEFEGETIYNFDDGESCNLRFIAKMTDNKSDLKNKFMVEIESPSNPWTFETIQPKKYIDESMKGEDIDIPSLHDILQGNGETANVVDSDIGKEKLVPPRNPQRIIDLPDIKDYVKEKKTSHIKPLDDVKHVESVVTPERIESAPVEPKNEPNHKSFDPVRILVDSCKKHDTQIELSLTIKLPSRTIANIADSEFENGADKFIDCVVSDIDSKMIIKELRNALKISYFDVEDEK